MTTEQEVSAKILENKGQASAQWIARQMRISNDYTRFICQKLVGKGLVDQFQTRDWYQITAKGKKELGFLEEKKPLPQRTKKKIKQTNKNPEVDLAQIIEKGVNKGVKKIAFCLTKCTKCIREMLKVESKT